MSMSRVTPILLLLSVHMVGCIEAQRAESDTTTADTVMPDTSAPDSVGPDASDPDTSPGEPCEGPGQTRCLGTEATQICNGGEWQTVACGQDRICIDFGGGQCVETSGQATCYDALYCLVTCQFAFTEEVDRNTCSVECVNNSSGDARNELGDTLTCFETCDDDEGEQLGCVAKTCSSELGACYFDGRGASGCLVLAQCIEACQGQPAECRNSCGTFATKQAQAEYAVLDLCVTYACVGQGDECGVAAIATGGACARYAAQCLTPGISPNDD